MIGNDLDIMTTDSDMDTSTNDVMTDDSTDIMTGNSQTLTRTIGKSKQDKDPNSLKIASFRTKEGVWSEFCQKAESDGLTATDVLRAAIEQYLSGEYNPRVITPVSTSARHTNNVLTRNDVLEIVNTAISTAISTEQLNDSIMTAISTLSLCSHADVSTAIHTAIHNASIGNNDTHGNTQRIDVLTMISTDVSTEIAALRAEIDALKSLAGIGKVIDTDSMDTTATTPHVDRESLTFAQLAAHLGYPIPEGVKASNANKEDAEALLLFAGDKAIEYKWHSKSRKFYKNVIG